MKIAYKFLAFLQHSLHIMVEMLFGKEGGKVTLLRHNRLFEQEETNTDLGDLDDFIFNGEEWHSSER